MAGPSSGPTGLPSQNAWSGATSGAAALTTRAVHSIHDALEAAFYPDDYIPLTLRQKALLAKALIVHRARV